MSKRSRRVPPLPFCWVKSLTLRTLTTCQSGRREKHPWCQTWRSFRYRLRPRNLQFYLMAQVMSHREGRLQTGLVSYQRRPSLPCRLLDRELCAQERHLCHFCRLEVSLSFYRTLLSIRLSLTYLHHLQLGFHLHPPYLLFRHSREDQRNWHP